MCDYGTLILGRQQIIEDIDIRKNYAIVKAKGKDILIPVPFDAISWISPDWTFTGNDD